MRDGRGVDLISIQLLYEVYVNAMKHADHESKSFSHNKLKEDAAMIKYLLPIGS